MKSFLILLNLLVVVLLFPELTSAKKDRIRLKDVQVLTLSEGKLTTGRRSSPIKQLRCIGGYCKRASITTAQCYNRGFDGRDVQWECKANMPDAYKFGRMEVAWEGYDYPEDDYILAGSCGLEYSIEEVNGPAPGQYHPPQYSYSSDSLDSEGSPVFVIIFIVFVIVFIYFACIHRSHRENDGAFPDTDDGRRPHASAPPPPGFRNDYYDDSCKGGSTRNSSTQNSSQSSGPGFFSGLATGGLLGYLFSGSGTSTRYRGDRSYYSSGYSMPSTSSGYSGGGGGSGSRSSSGYASTSRR